MEKKIQINTVLPSSINEDDIETIKEMADFLYKKWINTGSVRGQMLTARDDYLFHVIIATEAFIDKTKRATEKDG